MNRKLCLYIAIAFCSLSIGPQHSVGQGRSTQPSGLKAKTIYLDPSYGGKEKGPLVGRSQYAKDITLQIAKQIQNQLLAEGFAVNLSRSGDELVSPDERVTHARGKGSDVYLSINISRQKKECIRIKLFSPKLQKYQTEAKTRTLGELKDELDNILKRLQADAAYEESLHLAHIIAKKLEKTQPNKCVRVEKSVNYVLEYAEMPAVMVDFGVVLASSTQPYFLDLNVQNKMASDISASVKAFTAEHGARPKPE